MGVLVQRCVISSADRLEPRRLLGVFFSCMHAADWVGGWMPFAESQGQVTGTLSPSDSCCAAKLQRSLKPNRCPLLCVLGLGGWLGSSLSLSLTGTAWSLSLSLTCVHVYVCVHSPDPKLTPPLHPCGHLPPPGSHTHYQSSLMASN